MLTTGDCFRIVRTDFANLPSVVLHGNWGVSSNMMTHPVCSSYPVVYTGGHPASLVVMDIQCLLHVLPERIVLPEAKTDAVYSAGQ